MSAEDTFPKRVDFRKAALDRRSIEGELVLRDLPRTADVVVEGTTATVTATLDFDEDAQRRVVVEGTARTTLKLPCQRCLEPANVPLAIEIAGMAVSSDQAAADVPRDWEPMLASGDSLDLHSLIDDELLLALPITVQCDRPACRAEYEQSRVPSRDDVATPERENPFAALAALKTRDNDPDPD